MCYWTVWYRYDDFYFLTEPGMLIYSHCPEETSWQLLHPARSRTEYEEYPLVKSFFFSIGMQFLQQNRGIVFTKRGIVTITLGFTQPTAFTFKLTFGETGSDFLQVILLCLLFSVALLLTAWDFLLMSLCLISWMWWRSSQLVLCTNRKLFVKLYMFNNKWSLLMI